jgi:regulator of cell morphogenesis and NO signaling
MQAEQKKIGQLVEENLGYAATLHSLGIAFYEFETNTLAQACKKKGVNLEYVVNVLNNLQQEQRLSSYMLKQMPLEVLIAYLKHHHQAFLQRKLPYIASLIEHLSQKEEATAQFVKDLQVLFPLFADDFIHHIHEEEDSFFGYVLDLKNYFELPKNHLPILKHWETHTIQLYALQHDTHDDEMQGIRQVMQNYPIEGISSLHIKVVFLELQSFERELQLHASIENNILFPKALSLELDVRKMIAQKNQEN